ncbi:MAG: TIM barrel protein [Verrucomicrobia bacterium]|nr:TIM barrel protein [Verrucomicrobiota bacterium]
MNRRTACQILGVAALAPKVLLANRHEFKLRYVLNSAMFGEKVLDTILPVIPETGCESIDIWRRVHGNQREQITAMGDAAFERLLKKHNAKISMSSCYPLGPFGLQEEMVWLNQFGGKIIVTGAGKHPDADPVGAAAKAQVKGFLEKMKPHVAKAEETGITIALENHANQLLYHPDSLRYFAEFNKSPNLGIAFAPHHLHQWESEIPQLILDLGDSQIPFMYFQEHSDGIYEKVAKEIEMQQLPGYGGGLDYRLIVSALRDIKYTGLVEIFMHPVPRGIPILPTIGEIAAAINKSRDYINECLADTA